MQVGELCMYDTQIHSAKVWKRDLKDEIHTLNHRAIKTLYFTTFISYISRYKFN